MARIRNPVRFSTHFGIADTLLKKLGALDPTLNADTKLFIDPFLVPMSRHPEIAKGGRKTYEQHFEKVIKLLAGSKKYGDVAWRSARRLMEFPEVKWTCLGYGAQTISGSGSGAFTTDGVMQTAREIVDLGICVGSWLAYGLGSVSDDLPKCPNALALPKDIRSSGVSSRPTKLESAGAVRDTALRRR